MGLYPSFEVWSHFHGMSSWSKDRESVGFQICSKTFYFFFKIMFGKYLLICSVYLAGPKLLWELT